MDASRTDVFSAGDRVFIDESKARGYIVAATAASPSSIRDAEKALRGLLKPGQRRIHFKSERDSRRREIHARMCELDLRAAVWVTKGLPNKEARDMCLASVTSLCCLAQVATLVVERDESLMGADRKVISAVIRDETHQLRYYHSVPHEQPLLWVSDAVAWCYTKGGDWIRRTVPLIENRTIRL